VVKTNIGLKNN
jgi:hypothetical protein